MLIIFKPCALAGVTHAAEEPHAGVAPIAQRAIWLPRQPLCHQLLETPEMAVIDAELFEMRDRVEKV